MVQAAQLEGQFKLEGEEMGTKFFIRMGGAVGLAEQRVRKLLGCMRVGHGRESRWRELTATLPTGLRTPISLSIDKSGRTTRGCVGRDLQSFIS